jgi:hypothetical protein
MGLEIGKHNRSLREELQQIITKYTGDSAEDHVGLQVRLVASLAEKYKHSISLVEQGIPGTPEIYTVCYRHSFGLAKVGLVDRLLKCYNVETGREFAGFIIGRLHEIPPDDTHDGDHIIYSTADQIEHAGNVEGGLIESKWGKAHRWRHGVYEVPLSYGDIVRFYRHLPHEDAVSGFLDYARTKGINPKIALARS